MWTVLIFLNLLGPLHCTVSSSPSSPTDVIFSSVNLRNELQWLPGSGTQDDTQFTVQYAIYGDSVEGIKGRRVNWRAVQRCTEIVRSWCDLSNETWDLEHGYHARVRAVGRRAASKWVLTSRRFDPKTDTTFGPPLVSVEVEDNNAIIILKGPMRYQPNNHTPVVSMATLYPHMSYNLSINNARRGQTHHFRVVSSSYKFRLMDYDTEYCFSAKTSFLSMPAQCLSSAWHCVTTPQDPVIGQLQRVVVGIVVPSVFMCMLVVIGYFLYHYLSGKGQKSPYILNPPAFHPPPLTFPPENPKLIVITIIKDSQPKPLDPPRPQRPPSGYASQRPQTPEELWDDSSVDYGFIDMVPNIDVIGQNRYRDSYEKKQWNIEDSHSAGQTQTHAQTEMSTLIQALSFQGAAMGEVDSEEEEEGIEFPGLFINTTPQTGLFRIPLNLLTKKAGGMEEEMDGNMRVGTDGEMDGGAEERSESEVLPLLSAYAAQSTMPTSHSDQSDFLPDDYGVLRIATAHEIEEEEDEEGTLCIDWDPQTRKLLLPEMMPVMEYNKKGGLDGLMQGETGRENRMGGEEEKVVNPMKGELRLENVFVRQGSEEMADAQREMERVGNDFLNGWDLVISMDP